MTSTATQEEPATKTRPPMSAEHKAKLEAGRKRAAAEKAAAKAAIDAMRNEKPPVATTVTAAIDPRDAEIARLRAELAAKPAVEAATQGVELKAVQRYECIYRYKPKGGWREVATKGHSVISSADDPRWDGELQAPPYNGSVGGALEVALVTRVGDKKLESVDIQGGPCHMNEARQFMRDFTARVEAGDIRPWDTEHFHREQLALAEKAKQEGRTEDLKLIAAMFTQAMKGGAESVLQRTA